MVYVRARTYLLDKQIALWCNGNTPDFGSGNPRSNRGGATKKYPRGVMVAAIDSKSIAVWRAGSIPAVGTKANAKRPGAFPEMINTLFYEYRKI